MRRRSGEDSVHMAIRTSAEDIRMTRRRFLAVAGVAAGLTGARAAERPLAAQKADFATRFEEASRLVRAQTDSGKWRRRCCMSAGRARSCPAPSVRRESICRSCSRRRPSR